MKWLACLAVLATSCMNTPALAQGGVSLPGRAGFRLVTVTDPQTVLNLLRGDVQLIGATFPGGVFQSGVLALLRAHKINLTVLTTRAAAGSLGALRSSGGKVFALPGGVGMTGSIVLIGDDTAVLSRGDGRWLVMQGPGAAAQIKVNMVQYARYARPF